MNSGIKVPPEIIANNISKLQKKTNEFMILTINIVNKKTGNIVLDQEMEMNRSKEILTERNIDCSTLDVSPAWYLFRERMMEHTCSYGACHFTYTTADKGERSKLVFVTYVGGEANVTERMFYSTTKEEVKKRIEANYFVECSGKEDFEYEEIKSRVHTQ